MFFALFYHIKSEITENAYVVFKGNWTVKQEYLYNNTKKQESFYLHCDNANDQETYLQFSVLDSNESTDAIEKFNIRFISGGRFRFSLASEHGSDNTKVELFYNIAPHASATGTYSDIWIYNIDVITFKKVQVTLFNQETGEVYIWNLFKIVIPEPDLFEKYKFFFYAGILFVVCQFSSQFAIKRYESKLKAQAAERRKQASAQAAQQGKTPQKSPKVSETPTSSKAKTD